MKPDQRLLQRALTVYSVYGVRWDPLANVRELLPQGLKVVGFMGTADDIDISLWRPLGTPAGRTHSPERVAPTDSAAPYTICCGG